MRLFQFLLLILCLASANAFAQENGSFNLFQKLQGLGINLGQSNPQELLPPDEYETAERLLKEVEELSQDSFYGRCLGFQVSSMHCYNQYHNNLKCYLLLTSVYVYTMLSA